MFGISLHFEVTTEFPNTTTKIKKSDSAYTVKNKTFKRLKKEQTFSTGNCKLWLIPIVNVNLV